MGTHRVTDHEKNKCHVQYQFQYYKQVALLNVDQSINMYIKIAWLDLFKKLQANKY